MGTVPIPQGATIGDPVQAAPVQAQPQAQGGSMPIPEGATIGEPIQTKSTGPTMGPQSSSDHANPATATDPFQRAGRNMTGGFARLLMDATDKLREIENFTEEGKGAHPVQAFMGHIANKLEGLTFGNEAHPEEGIGTGKYGFLNNPLSAALIPGAEGEPALAAGLKGGASLAKGAYQAGKELLSGGKAAESVTAASKGPSLVTQLHQGEKVAQSPARAAFESGAKASAEDAGVAAPNTKGQAVRRLLDEPIQNIAKTERGTYDAVNKAAGTDMKSLHDYKGELEDALDDPTNVANRQALQKELKTTQDSISKGEAQAIKNGVDPAALKKAEGMTQQRYAMENLKQRLFNNESVVKGNMEHGTEESLNVDAAIREVEKLDKPSKFAKEGGPTRLEQALGKGGAMKLKQGLYDAQKAGKVAIDKQEMLNKVLKIGGAVGGIGTGLGIISHVVKGQ